MRKEAIILVFILLFTVSFVSAGWWGDITGRVINNPCTDSDGIDYDIKGTAEGCNWKEECGEFTDYCEGDNVVEYLCNNNEVMEDTYTQCENGCENGACKQEENEACTDSDGIDYDIKGTAEGCNWKEECGEFTDYCEGDNVVEYLCNNNEVMEDTYTQCENGCENGACKQEESCQDTCSSLGYNCGTQNVCGENIECGVCDTNYKCEGSTCVENKTDEYTFFDPFGVKCPEHCSTINGKQIPQIANAVPTSDLNQFLDKTIIIREKQYNDWFNYAPLETMVDELTSGVTSQLEKAEKIINWAHKSQLYCTKDLEQESICYSGTNAVPQSDFPEIFNAEYGVCMDSSLITTAMLRKAGIPSNIMIISINHAVVIFNINGEWYNADPTFCLDGGSCNDPKITKLDQTSGTALFYYSDRKAMFENSDNGLYCDMSNICYNAEATGMLKFFTIDSGEGLTEIIIPNKKNFISEKFLTQYQCKFAFGYLVCDNLGCSYIGEDFNPIEEINIWQSMVGEQQYFIEGEEIGHGYMYTRFLADKPYRLTCNVMYEGHPDYEQITANYIIPKKNSLNIISPDNLEMVDGADVEKFNELKSLMSQSVEGIDLDAIIYGIPTNKEVIAKATSGDITKESTACLGCLVNNNCYQIGHRNKYQYCSNDGFVNQSNEEEYCENNFECSANLCIDNECISSGVWRKFLGWFKRFF